MHADHAEMMSGVRPHPLFNNLHIPQTTSHVAHFHTLFPCVSPHAWLTGRRLQVEVVQKKQEELESELQALSHKVRAQPLYCPTTSC